MPEFSIQIYVSSSEAITRMKGIENERERVVGEGEEAEEDEAGQTA